MDTAQPQVENIVSPQTEDVDTQPTETTPFLTVKYNKEEVALDAEKAREYAQKGMNYDKLHEKYESLQAKGAEFESYEEFLSLGKDLASESGISLKDLAKQMRERKAQQKDEQIADAEGIPVEVARKLRVEREEKERLLREKEELSQKAKSYEDKEATQARFNAELDAFVEKYGKAELPDNVREQWASGVPLLTAYELHEAKERISQMEKEREVQKVNDENAAASPGNLGTAGQYEPEITEESIKKMSPAELQKNHNRIRKFLGWGD